MDADSTADAPEEQVPEVSNDKSKKHLTVKTKTLTEAELSEYTIFDIIMPLPGFDVAYPGGELGERYRTFMKVDGLDPDDMRRDRLYVVPFSFPCISVHLQLRLLLIGNTLYLARTVRSCTIRKRCPGK